MDPINNSARTAVRFTAFLLGVIIWMAALHPIGLAWAKRPLGIAGEMAPDIQLDTWIDGDGVKRDPVRLNDYRGKVIYLYFFQDW